MLNEEFIEQVVVCKVFMTKFYWNIQRILLKMLSLLWHKTNALFSDLVT